MRCRFCEEDKKLIEAHIIPRCRLQALNSPSGPMVLISKDSHAKRLQTGQYDDKILCADCDNKFAPWEDDTADLLVRAGAYDQFRQAKPGENFAIAHAPFEGVKMGRCLGLYFFGCGDIANMSQPSGDTAA